MTEPLAIGVDIGGTKIAFVAIDRAGTILGTHRLPTPVRDGPDAVFAQVADGIHTLTHNLEGPIAGVGIGCPGRLNARTGLVYKATNLQWDHVHLLQGVRQHLEMPIPMWLQQDANAAALGEMHFGAARGYADFVLITIGTGLGGGAFVDGRIIEGAAHSGMEIGHMPLNPTGRLCICGMRGCPEMYVSGVGLLAGAREHLPRFPQSSLHRVDDLTTKAIVEAFTQDDPLAVHLLDECTDWLCAVMITCMGIVNPGLFVIGGGLGHALFDFLAEDVQRKLSARTSPEIHPPVPVVASQVRDSAVGAAALVWHNLEHAADETNIQTQ